MYITSVNQSIPENLKLVEFLGFLFGSSYTGLEIGAINNVIWPDLSDQLMTNERVDAQSFGKQTADAKADRRTSFF